MELTKTNKLTLKSKKKPPKNEKETKERSLGSTPPIIFQLKPTLVKNF